MSNPFRYFNSSPEVIRTAVLMYVKYPLSLRNVEDLLAERGIDVCHETVRQWWNRFGPMFAAQIKKKRVSARFGMRGALDQQPRRELAPAVPAARVRHAPIQTDEHTAEIHLRARSLTQPLQPRSTSHKPHYLQGESLCRHGRVANPCKLTFWRVDVPRLRQIRYY